METNSNGTRARRKPGESEFCEMHRIDLPKKLYFSDFDSGLFTNNNKIYSFVDEQNTFIEYQKAGWNLCAFKAIFDLKTESELEDAKSLQPFGAVWAQWQVAQRLSCRFFLVSYTGRKKEPPYVFWEVMSGVVRNVGTLEYTENNRREISTNFWVKLGLITKEEAAQHLKVEEGNFEVEAVYLNEKNQYEKRYFNSFPTIKIAEQKYLAGLQTLRASKTNAIMVMRQLKNNMWHLLKSERV